MTRQEHNEAAVFEASEILKKAGIQQWAVIAADFTEDRSSLRYGARKLHCSPTNMTAIVANLIVDWADRFKQAGFDAEPQDFVNDIAEAVKAEVKKREE